MLCGGVWFGIHEHLVEDDKEEDEGCAASEGGDECGGVFDPGGEDVGFERDPVHDGFHDGVEEFAQQIEAGRNGQCRSERRVFAREEGDDEHDGDDGKGPDDGDV